MSVVRFHPTAPIPICGITLENMLALIDGDIVVHRVGYTTDNDPEWVAQARAAEMIELILDDTKASAYEIYLSDTYENNFRKRLDPNYKANRTAPRPVHYRFLKEYLTNEWEANLALGMEADDMLGIRQVELEETCICSIDKDLLQIPGDHYNFVKKEWKFVTEVEGIRHFYKQLLIGDTSDNIAGVRGLGPVRASRLLDPCETQFLMFDVVRDIYQDDDRLLKNGKLLWIKRTEDDIWKFPKDLRPVAEAKLESTMMMPEAPTQFTEPTGTDKNGSSALGLQEVESTPKMDIGVI